MLSLIAALSLQAPPCTISLEVAKTAKPGAAVTGTVLLTIPEGFHAYAPVKDAMVLPVLVEAKKGSAGKLVGVVYPKGIEKSYPGLGDEKVSAYEGDVKLCFTYRLPKSPPEQTLELSVRVQLCSNDNGVCYPPSTLWAKAKIRLVK